MKKIELKDLVSRLLDSLRRFPASMAFLSALTIILFYLIHVEDVPEDNNIFFLVYYPATAVLLNILIVLGLEERKRNSKPVGAGYQAVCYGLLNVIWLGVCLWIRGNWPLDMSWSVAAGVLAFSMFMAVFLLPFLRKDKNDLGFWNYSWGVFYAILIAFVTGGLLDGGLSFLVLSVDTLFVVDVPDRTYADVAVLCMVFIAPMVFLQLLPSGREVHDSHSENPGKVALWIMRNLFRPLVALYLLVLYLYIIQIVFRWDLPRGWVTWPVAVFILCSLKLVFIFYPVRFRKVREEQAVTDGNRALSGEPRKTEETIADRNFRKWLPWLFLPLLLLMTVAIWKRVSDYGITAPRLYLILFNVWCYIVCIGLIVNKSRRIWWIPASFVAVLLLSSVGPQNMSAVARRNIVNNIKSEILVRVNDNVIQGLSLSGSPSAAPGHGNSGAPLTAADVFPLDSAGYFSLMENSDSAFVVNVDDRMEYLFMTYPEKTVREIVDSTVRLSLLGRSAYSVRVSDSGPSNVLSYGWPSSPLPVPEGFSRFQQTSHFYQSLPKTDTLEFSLSADSVRFRVPMAVFENAAGPDDSPLWLDGDNGKLSVDYFNVYVETNYIGLSISGTLWLK